MRCLIPIILFYAVILSGAQGCTGESAPQTSTDTTPDTMQTVALPQFDISGKYYARLNNAVISDTASGDSFFIPNARETDTLFIQYTAATPCEECRLETQIWNDAKYKDIVRDTGYGTGHWTAIPLSQLKYNPESATQEVSFYLSVRQYHPVETGNKRFLFNLKLEFTEE